MTPDTTALLLTDDAPLQLGHFTLDRTGLAVMGRPPYEEWEKCGAFLQQIEGAVQWWIGDWLNYGEHAYGEKYSQALDATGIKLRTLESCAYVAAHVETTRRRVGVGWTLYQDLASLPSDQQEDWLVKVVAGDWTRARLRTELRLQNRRVQYATGDLPDGQFRGKRPVSPVRRNRDPRGTDRASPWRAGSTGGREGVAASRGACRAVAYGSTG